MARFWPASYHLMAQDILKFHAIIWPALLMTAGYELPEGELIHGYLKLGGEKMCKTRGNVIDPFAVIEEFGADPFRFYLLREVSFGQDGVVSDEGFKARYNNELANELGNLREPQRSMIGKYREGTIPSPRPPTSRRRTWRPRARRWCAPPARTTTPSRSRPPSRACWEYVRRLNRLVEEEAPWKLAKDESQAARLDAVLFGLAAGLRLVALALYPVIPGTAVELLRRLGQPTEERRLLLETRALVAAAAGGRGAGAAAVPAPRDGLSPAFALRRGASTHVPHRLALSSGDA